MTPPSTETTAPDPRQAANRSLQSDTVGAIVECCE